MRKVILLLRVSVRGIFNPSFDDSNKIQSFEAEIPITELRLWLKKGDLQASVVCLSGPLKSLKCKCWQKCSFHQIKNLNLTLLLKV